MNIFACTARVATEPELRTTSTGKSVTSFRIAIDGFKKDEPTWLGVNCWGPQAEYAAEYLSKGRLVAIEGRINSRKYTASDGGNREVVEVVVSNIHALDRPKDDAPKTNEGGGSDLGYDPFRG